MKKFERTGPKTSRKYKVVLESDPEPQGILS